VVYDFSSIFIDGASPPSLKKLCAFNAISNLDYHSWMGSRFLIL
jgi:hypothetical protein